MGERRNSFYGIKEKRNIRCVSRCSREHIHGFQKQKDVRRWPMEREKKGWQQHSATHGKCCPEMPAQREDLAERKGSLSSRSRMTLWPKGTLESRMGLLLGWGASPPEGLTVCRGSKAAMVPLLSTPCAPQRPFPPRSLSQRKPRFLEPLLLRRLLLPPWNPSCPQLPSQALHLESWLTTLLPRPQVHVPVFYICFVQLSFFS